MKLVFSFSSSFCSCLYCLELLVAFIKWFFNFLIVYCGYWEPLLCSLAVVCGFLFVSRDYGLGKEAMLDYMSHCGTPRRDCCRSYVQWRINALIGWILFASHRQQLPFGRLTHISLSSARDFISYFVFWWYNLGMVGFFLVLFIMW